jgi:hypothetical protein
MLIALRFGFQNELNRTSQSRLHLWVPIIGPAAWQPAIWYRRPVISDLDIWRGAHILICRHSADANATDVKFGRKPTLTPHQQKEARKRLEAGETQRSVARSYNVSQSTISRLTP